MCVYVCVGVYVLAFVCEFYFCVFSFTFSSLLHFLPPIYIFASRISHFFYSAESRLRPLHLFVCLACLFVFVCVRNRDKENENESEQTSEREKREKREREREE